MNAIKASKKMQNLFNQSFDKNAFAKLLISEADKYFKKGHELSRKAWNDFFEKNPEAMKCKHEWSYCSKSQMVEEVKRNET